MKVLVVVCCLLVAVALGDHEKEEMTKFVEVLKGEMDQCAKEQNFSPEDMQKVRDGVESGDDKAAGCVRACVLEKINVVQGGELKIENFKSTVEKVHEGHPDMVENRMKMLESCASEAKEKTDKCDMANALAKCYLEKVKESH